MTSLIFALIMGIGGGSLIAWTLYSPANRKRYAQQKASFEAGQGRNPDKAALGCHKPFYVNALILGGILAVVGVFIGQAV